MLQSDTMVALSAFLTERWRLHAGDGMPGWISSLRRLMAKDRG